MRRTALFLVLFLASLAAQARVLSYGPVTAQGAIPAAQERDRRHYALLETTGRILLFDSLTDDVRTIFPTAETEGWVTSEVAVWERQEGIPPKILVGVWQSSVFTRHRFYLSEDGGGSWKRLDFPETRSVALQARRDVGGAFSRSFPWQIQLGNASVPFIVATRELNSTTLEIDAIESGGHVKSLGSFDGAGLIGADASGSRALVAGRRATSSGLEADGVWKVSLSGNSERVLTFETGNPGVYGWIAPNGAVLLDSVGFGAQRALVRCDRGRSQLLATLPAGFVSTELSFFAVPTRDADGAWIVQRETGRRTTLFLYHDGDAAPVEQWSDPTAPQIEAIHESRSGKALLIQVHRPREMPIASIFVDPALAIWHPGEPAPTDYDELYLNEADRRGFVHLDVDDADAGGTFVFDAGVFFPPQYSGGGGGISSGGGGGGDIFQEWGVVRSSLQQHLVLPSISHLSGAYGSEWRSDVVLRNPADVPVIVTMRLLPLDGSQQDVQTRTVTLGAREIRLIRDAALTLFGIDHGGGALHLLPERRQSIEVTSRTYSENDHGTFGMTIPAIDAQAAANPNVPLYFSAALAEPTLRSNVLLQNVSSGSAGEVEIAASNQRAVLPFLGSLQLNNARAFLGLESYYPLSITMVPRTGRLLGSVITIDNQTNDPSYFSPDVLLTNTIRTIPIVGHVEGANGSHFRTDLYVSNPTNQTQWMNLIFKPWDGADAEVSKNIVVGPNVTLALHDVVANTFYRSGLGRVRFSATALTVTSRTYTAAEDGSTYGTAIPPLNAFQIAQSGDSLEILGVSGLRRFRTNLALLETSPAPFAQPRPITHAVTIEVLDERGTVIDTIETAIAEGGSVMMADLFRARNLPQVQAGLIRVTPHSGQFTAFASLVDQATNDPSYLPPMLAAK